MNNSKLIQLIRESINDYIREIDEAGNVAALEAKMNKTQEAIELREKKMNMEGIDEAYHDMIDKGKMKELSGEVKALKKSLAKYEKQLEKLKNKGSKAEKVEDTEEKEIVDEVKIDENDPENGPQLEETNENTKYESDEGNPYNVPNPQRKNLRGFKGMDWQEEDFEEEPKKPEETDKEQTDEDMNIYEVLHMQKLAGILSETEYKAKVEEAKKMTAAQKEKKEDIVKGMKKSKNFGKSKDEKAKMYATATKLATKKKLKV